MILFVGAHYLIILRNPDLLHDRTAINKWRLYNDTQIKDFRDWSQVTKYCVESKCLPTVLFYECNDDLDKGLRQQYLSDSLLLQKYEIQDLEQIALE